MENQKGSTVKRINIAIDGYAGCGKSTLARDLAKAMEYTFVDTGALYRAITWLSSGAGSVTSVIAEKPRLSFESGTNAMIINGENREAEIRSTAVAERVSQVAAMPEVRSFLRSIQERFIVEKGVVMEGRDIGTVIMPDADVKLFITASMEARVQRRWLQLKHDGQEVSREKVEQNLGSRDQKDASRELAPLAKAEDAIALDTSNFDREQQLEVVLAMIRPKVYPEAYLPFL